MGGKERPMKTEKIPVLINLLALARYNQMPDYPIQVMTRGELSFPGGPGFLLEYRELQDDEETGKVNSADVSLSVEGNRVTMLRSGECFNTMVFDQKHRFEGTYHTPFGDMDMAVDTRDVSCHMSPERGNIHLRYLLHFNGSYASTNELHLEYYSEESLRKGKEAAENENPAQ